MSDRFRISDNHRRSISITLGLLDETLCRFQSWAEGTHGQGVLYRQQDDLTHSQREKVLREIAAVRRLLGELKDSLALEPTTQDLAGAIWSESLGHLEALVELGSKYLRRYGETPAGFAEYFDPRIEAIIGHMVRIARAAGHSDRDATEEQAG